MLDTFTRQLIKTSGAEILVRSAGAGEPLVLLHGYPQTGVMWHRVANQLANDFFVVCPDLRGYGDSSNPDGGLRHENKASNCKFSILSDLFERCSKNFSKDQLSMKTELLASDIEGYSGKNTLGLKLLGPSANLQELIEIYSDVISNPLFIEKELEIVKRDTMSYLNRKKQNYAALTADKFYEKLFPNHPYSMNQYGTEESLVNISQDNISKAYRETITKNN